MGESICIGCQKPRVRIVRLSNVVGNNSKYNEILLNGLRLTNGIPIKKLERVNQNVLNDLKTGLQKWNNKLAINKESLYLTEKGIPFLDSILPDIFIN